MRLADFDFDLPPELIAQHPPARREDARMLVVRRAANDWRDARFAELPDHLRPGDALVLNNTRVFPARLVGRRTREEGQDEGARVELFLIEEREGPHVWEALARPARRLRPGSLVSFDAAGRLRAEILEALPDGHRLVRFHPAEDFHALLEELGQTPLPPYIKRAEDHPTEEDRARYQTIYARRRGAIAAPTAGLHFTPRVLDEIKAHGVEVIEITLHVGYGTFAPVRATEDLGAHRVAAERCEIEEAAAARINEARANGRRVIAVGTTTTRALESAADETRRVASGTHMADLTIVPGYRFRVVDGLVTNFHLPQSSLLLLAAAFAGRETILRAYRHAVVEKYRFYSYGDCMSII